MNTNIGSALSFYASQASTAQLQQQTTQQSIQAHYWSDNPNLPNAANSNSGFAEAVSGFINDPEIPQQTGIYSSQQAQLWEQTIAQQSIHATNPNLPNAANSNSGFEEAISGFITNDPEQSQQTGIGGTINNILSEEHVDIDHLLNLTKKAENTKPQSQAKPKEEKPQSAWSSLVDLYHGVSNAAHTVSDVYHGVTDTVSTVSHAVVDPFVNVSNILEETTTVPGIISSASNKENK